MTRFAQAILKHMGDGLCCKSAIENQMECGTIADCGSCELLQSFSEAIRGNHASFNDEINKTLIINGKENSVWLKTAVSRIVIDGNIHAVIALVDITEMKHAEIVLQLKNN
jgi:hypothetical protein